LDGYIGAAQSRLGSALRTSDQTVLNYLAAEGRLQDLDIAGETAAATATSIRQQAAAALLGQATLAPRIALDLLRAA
jgi:flagellin-like hook-associated protein FlgL